MKEYEIQEATHLQQTSESLGPSFIHLANLKELFIPCVQPPVGSQGNINLNCVLGLALRKHPL